MNQTHLRLEMILLAIAAGDYDIVHHLKLKLSPLAGEARIDEILSALDAKNYATARQSIERYLQDPPDTSTGFENDEVLKEKFELFELETEETPHIVDDFTTITSQTVPLDGSSKNEIDEDDFTELLRIDDELSNDDDTTKPPRNETETLFEDLKELDEIPTENLRERSYEPIEYALKKFEHLKRQYPPQNASDTLAKEVLTHIETIETSGIDEAEIERLIDKAYEYKARNEYDLAAQYFLLAAVTPSLYAKHILARELFRGDVFEKNVDEAVSIFNDLTFNERYPEAMCDLAQLYEHGIAVKRDHKKALSLYKQAMYGGIKRAEKHYIRLHKKHRGLLSFLKR